MPQTSDYTGAVAHYASPDRRDAVKRLWEEPDLVALLDDALAATRTSPAPGAAAHTDASVRRVLDVGCGPGTVLELLHRTEAVRDGLQLRYLGMDLDDDLLELARHRHDDPHVLFERGDIRDGVPGGDHDLIVSSGVPYSHLTPDELRTALGHQVDHAGRRDRPTVLVVDVLGRYSLEWTSRWATTRWDYRMSFFATDGPIPRAPMTTWSGEDLRTCIESLAAERPAVELTDCRLVDRSLVVGRHTMTGDYTPGLPRFRDLVDGLIDPAVVIDLDALRLALDLPDAPQPVLDAHARLAQAWNHALDQAAQAAEGEPRDQVAAVLQPELFHTLHEVEQRVQAGLGMGHSLTALVHLAPRP